MATFFGGNCSSTRSCFSVLLLLLREFARDPAELKEAGLEDDRRNQQRVAELSAR